LHVFRVILVGLVLLSYLLVAQQNPLLFVEVHLLTHLDLLVLLRNNFLGFVTKCTPLLVVLLNQCAFLRVLGFLGFEHEIALVVPIHAFNCPVLLFNCNGFIKLIGHVFLVQDFLDLRLRLFSLVNLISMLLHCGPLIYVTFLVQRVVALLIVVHIAYLLHLLVEWLFYSVGHLQRVHNRVAAS